MSQCIICGEELPEGRQICDKHIKELNNELKQREKVNVCTIRKNLNLILKNIEYFNKKELIILFTYIEYNMNKDDIKLLAKKWNCTINNIYQIRLSAYKKLLELMEKEE